MQVKYSDLRVFLNDMLTNSGMTITELADSVGYTRTQVSKIVNGKASGSAKFWEKIYDLQQKMYGLPRQEQWEFAVKLTPKAHAALALIQKLEGGSETEIVSRMLELHGSRLLQEPAPMQSTDRHTNDEK